MTLNRKNSSNIVNLLNIYLTIYGMIHHLNVLQDFSDGTRPPPTGSDSLLPLAVDEAIDGIDE